MAQRLFPLERLFYDTDKIMRTVKKLPRRQGRDTVAALLLAAATVATKRGTTNTNFNAALIWRGAWQQNRKNAPPRDIRRKRPKTT